MEKITLLASVALAAACAASGASPKLACDLKALTPAQRTEYKTLSTKLHGAVAGYSPQAEGYRFSVDLARLPMSGLGKWIGFERLCCPFLTFTLTVEPDSNTAILALTGPPGTRAFLEAELGLQATQP